MSFYFILDKKNKTKGNPVKISFYFLLQKLVARGGKTMKQLIKQRPPSLVVSGLDWEGGQFRLQGVKSLQAETAFSLPQIFGFHSRNDLMRIPTSLFLIIIFRILMKRQSTFPDNNQNISKNNIRALLSHLTSGDIFKCG